MKGMIDAAVTEPLEMRTFFTFLCISGNRQAVYTYIIGSAFTLGGIRWKPIIA